MSKMKKIGRRSFFKRTAGGIAAIKIAKEFPATCSPLPPKEIVEEIVDDGATFSDSHSWSPSPSYSISISSSPSPSRWDE